MLGWTSEQLGTVILAVSGAIIWLMGGQKGKQLAQGKSQPGEMMEVAGAIVSDRAVERMVTALDGFTASAKLLTLAIDKDVEAKGKLTTALARNADAAEEVHDEIKDVAVRLDRLKDELIRSSAGGR